MIHSSTLEYSSRLPVLVCGTGTFYLKLRGFSWEPDYTHYPLGRGLAVLSRSTSRVDLPAQNISTRFNELFRQFAVLSLLRHPFAVEGSTGILTSWPSTTPFGFALGPD